MSTNILLCSDKFLFSWFWGHISKLKSVLASTEYLNYKYSKQKNGERFIKRDCINIFRMPMDGTDN